ncbi:MAG TPA: PDZ domain-containing protein [Opitutaceae bacterium]|nr:PDZ domain-containing protein [Opitutaceae bacterium]
MTPTPSPKGRLSVRSALVAFSLFVGAASAQTPATKSAAAKITPAEDPMLTRVFPSIVRIEVIRLRPSDGRLTKQWTAGSGVIISAEGHVVTNCHVTEDGDYFRCYLFDGSHVDARRVGQDALTDLAVLKLDLTQRVKDAPPLVVTKFADSDKLGAGDVVFALGSPGFLSQSVTRGVVSNPSLVLPEQTAGRFVLRGENVGTLVRWILHDAQIFGGNSGGPLVNDRGEIVGINEIGVFNLGGAIPSNVARVVANNLIEHGRVIRGWTGITVQPRLEADGEGEGVIISDVATASPAAKAGLQPGDLIIACDGHTIEGGEEKAVAHFNRLETSQLPEKDFSIAYVRGGAKQTARVKLTSREPAQADDVELKPWGAVVRDLTQKLVRDERLPDQRGIWLENVQPVGPGGQAEPTLRRQDVLVAVDGKSVHTVEELRALTKTLLAAAPDGKRTVLASVRRDGAVLSSVVELRTTLDYNVTTQARKAWLGASSQPLTPKLSARMGIKADGGARLTRIYPGTQAEAAGLQIGDVIVALDGAEVSARRPEDTDVLARQIRQYKNGAQAVFTLWRDGKKMEVPVTLEQAPVPAAELVRYDDQELEFVAREIAFDDRVRLQLPTDAKGAFVESAVPAGWAALGGLRSDDLIEKAGDVLVTSPTQLKQLREQAVASGKAWWVLLVRRRGQTLFVEINLKAAKPKP